MLDALDTFDLAAAVERWQPDPECLAAGDRYLDLAVRCYAAAGLSDRQLARRAGIQLGYKLPPPWLDDDAAGLIAWHCAEGGLPFHQVIAVLVYLATEVPGSPDDPDELAWIARQAVREAAP